MSELKRRIQDVYWRDIPIDTSSCSKAIFACRDLEEIALEAIEEIERLRSAALSPEVRETLQACVNFIGMTQAYKTGHTGAAFIVKKANALLAVAQPEKQQDG